MARENSSSPVLDRARPTNVSVSCPSLGDRETLLTLYIGLAILVVLLTIFLVKSVDTFVV
jgi:hypothetical protein